MGEVPDPIPAPEPLAELCAKCGFTYYNHESNTGVPYPCWTPSGRYSVDKRTNAPTSPDPLQSVPPEKPRMSQRIEQEVGEFHERDGWYFKRLPDGSVRIRVERLRVLPDGWTHEEHIISANSWCSIIAEVGRYGETPHTFSEGQAFHGAPR